jgi:hypothetical protein
MDLLLDYSSHPAMFSFPLSLSSSTPCATAQLYIVLPEAVSGAKLCFLHDPTMLMPPGSSLPNGSATLYFLGRVWLWKVGLALTVLWDS